MDCSVTRLLWRSLMPGKQFDKLVLLGFNRFQWCNEEICHAALITFAIHDFYRYWSHASHRHNYNAAQCARAIAHFATTALDGSRGSITSSFVAKCRSLLTNPA